MIPLCVESVNPKSLLVIVDGDCTSKKFSDPLTKMRASVAYIILKAISNPERFILLSEFGDSSRIRGSN